MQSSVRNSPSVIEQVGTLPYFTLVVPVFKVQSYLAECLESVLKQDFDDFELIAVDDCSPDNCGRILDSYAEQDPRVRVLHLPENVGLGRARNAALTQATGEYLLFLDSDDTLTPGSLSAIAARIKAADNPQVLIYDYERTYWWGKVLRNTLAHLLDEEGPASFALSERPELLNLLQIVWNKAYRRDFVESEGFLFPPGYYEDAPWTYCSMIAAESIAVLDRVCVQYRQRREGGNILATRSRKHFDAFDQYARIFDFLDNRPELHTWRGPLFRKMVDHYLTILEKPERLPVEARAEFFHRASAHYRAHVPDNFLRPEGNRGHKYALIERDAYALLTSSGAASRTKRALRSRTRKTVNKSKRKAQNLIYRSQVRRAKVDENLALFSAYWSRGVSCNPAAIAAELARLAPEIQQVWAVHADRMEQLPPGTEAVAIGSREFWNTTVRAKYFVNNVNFSDAVIKREGQIHLQTHHGTPLKSMGLDQRKYPASTTMSFKKMLSRSDRWDYSLSSNSFSTAIWERVYPCNYVSLETGYPRNDVLVNAGAEEVRAARAALGLAEGTRALLYMPTHREYAPGFAPRLDLARVSEQLGEDTVLLMRGHYFYDRSPGLAALRSSGRIVDVSAHPTVETLYLAADALITDYSSAMFDYANLDRPIVTFADDWEIYSTVRGTYFNLLEEGPGAVAVTEEQLVRVFTSGEWQGAAAAEKRDAFRRRFCEYDDGRAAERVVRRVFLGEEELLPFVPFEERLPAPAPSALPPAPVTLMA